MLRRLTVVGAVSSLTNWGHHNTDKYSGIQCLSESNEILHSFLSDMIWVCVCAQACFVCVCACVCGCVRYVESECVPNGECAAVTGVGLLNRNLTQRALSLSQPLLSCDELNT